MMCEDGPREHIAIGTDWCPKRTTTPHAIASSEEGQLPTTPHDTNFPCSDPQDGAHVRDGQVSQIPDTVRLRQAGCESRPRASGGVGTDLVKSHRAYEER